MHENIKLFTYNLAAFFIMRNNRLIFKNSEWNLRSSAFANKKSWYLLADKMSSEFFKDFCRKKTDNNGFLDYLIHFHIRIFFTSPQKIKINLLCCYDVQCACMCIVFFTFFFSFSFHITLYCFDSYIYIYYITYKIAKMLWNGHSNQNIGDKFGGKKRSNPNPTKQEFSKSQHVCQ